MKTRLFIILLPLLSFAFASCSSTANHAPTYVPVARKVAPTVESLTRHREQTPEELEAAGAAASKYFRELKQTILDLDDGATSAEVIARTAVSRNLDSLRAKAIAQTAHIAASTEFNKRMVAEFVGRLPRQKEIDDATFMVLKLRRQ